MLDAPPRYYWDANVFLSYIHQVLERAPDIDALLDAARDRKVEIVTSTLSIVEVAFGAEEELGGNMSAEIESAIEKLWVSPSPVKMVDFSPLIGRIARKVDQAGPRTRMEPDSQPTRFISPLRSRWP